VISPTRSGRGETACGSVGRGFVLLVALVSPGVEGLRVVYPLDRFLAEHEDELGPLLTDALADALDQRKKE
jgi:hypothetical protein